MTGDPNPYAAPDLDRAAPTETLESAAFAPIRTRLSGDDVDRIRAMAKTMRFVGIAWCVFAVVAGIGSLQFRAPTPTTTLAMAPLAIQGVVLFRAARPMRRAVRKGRADVHALTRSIRLLRWVFVLSAMASLFVAASSFISRVVEPHLARSKLEQSP